MGLAKYCWVLFILFISIGFSSAGADEKNTEATRAYSLGEIVVSAGLPGADTIPTLEITDKDIEKRNAKTLDKALELLPGIDVSIGGSV